jgi:Uncharacterised nucleotidyltransferase
MNRDAMQLVDALRDPKSTAALDANGWTALISMAWAEQLIGSLAVRLKDQALPAPVKAILADAALNAEQQKRSALWEAECAARALSDYPGKIILMKGTAYVAASLVAGEGRHIGDLDIMVAHDDLTQVENALIEKGGWEWVKDDAYDDGYYRTHMHELPPLIHTERDRMIDVHHTILPLTARPRPDAQAMLADAIPLDNALYILSPTDMACHCAAHLIADGDLAGGLRNLWDYHCLFGEFGDEAFWPALQSRAQHHQLWPAVHRAARLAHILYGTEIPKDWQSRPWQDRWFIKRMTARNGWGCETRNVIRLVFYIRSHWMRMPPLMLARHLWTKWRKGH